jgi:hypothetical protein
MWVSLGYFLQGMTTILLSLNQWIKQKFAAIQFFFFFFVSWGGVEPGPLLLKPDHDANVDMSVEQSMECLARETEVKKYCPSAALCTIDPK